MLIIVQMLKQVKMNSFTHLKALLVLYDRRIWACVSLGSIAPTEFTQIVVLQLCNFIKVCVADWYPFDTGTTWPTA
jgi:hypothetical protein